MSKDNESNSQHRIIYSVNEINQHINELLRSSFRQIWIRGEISNLRFAASGHCYLSIKDENAVIQAVVFKRTVSGIGGPEKLREGLNGLFFGNISVYSQRGQYQLVIQDLEASGEGDLYVAFERLKKQLSREGLFAPERKKRIPVFPNRVGIVTSSSGAALQDILRVSKKRCPGIDIIIYPTLVQGKEAAAQIVAALQQADRDREVDVLILSRGGGSLEDLWPFNEEIVGRTIAATELPIVSGVGHETDFTISDLAADTRAATPSAAAETVFPDRASLLEGISTFAERMDIYLTQRLERIQEKLNRYSPEFLANRLANGLDRKKMHFDSLQSECNNGYTRIIREKQAAFQIQKEKLFALNPAAPLRKGFALVYKEDTLIRDAEKVSVDDTVTLHFQRGNADARICTVHPQTDKEQTDE